MQEPKYEKQVSAFASLMLTKLRKNSFKYGWKLYDNETGQFKPSVSNDFLVDKLLEEVAELLTLIIKPQSDKDLESLVDQFDSKLLNEWYSRGKGTTSVKDAIRHEAADVGNISMMLADNNGGLE